MCDEAVIRPSVKIIWFIMAKDSDCAGEVPKHLFKLFPTATKELLVPESRIVGQIPGYAVLQVALVRIDVAPFTYVGLLVPAVWRYENVRCQAVRQEMVRRIRIADARDLNQQISGAIEGDHTLWECAAVGEVHRRQEGVLPWQGRQWWRQWWRYWRH